MNHKIGLILVGKRKNPNIFLVFNLFIIPVLNFSESHGGQYRLLLLYRNTLLKMKPRLNYEQMK